MFGGVQIGRFLPFLFLCCCEINASEADFKEDSEILEQLFDGYDKLKSPSKQKYEPVTVSVALHIEQVAILSESAHTLMEVDLYIRQTWEDPRLQHSGRHQPVLKLSSSFADKIWKPDLSFENARTFNKVSLGEDASGILIIWPEGRVVLGAKAHLKTYCPLNMAWFPFDTQECQIVLQSQKYHIWDMDLFWDEYSGATFSSDLSSEEFSLQGLQTTKGMQNFSSGSYSELRLNAELRRKAAHYVMTVHLPALMISMISCVSLWIPKVQAGARLAIVTVAIYAILLLYCMSKSAHGNYSLFPTVADIYLLLCLLFNFLVMATSLCQSHCRIYARRKNNKDGYDGNESLDSLQRSN